MSLVYTAFMAFILYFSVRTIFLAFSHFTFENWFSRKEYVNALYDTNEISSDGVCESSRNIDHDENDDEYHSVEDDHDDDAYNRVNEPEFSETSFSDEELSDTSSSETTEPDISDTDDLSSPESDLSEIQLCDMTQETTLVETDVLTESGTSTDLTEHIE